MQSRCLSQARTQTRSGIYSHIYSHIERLARLPCDGTPRRPRRPGLCPDRRAWPAAAQPEEEKGEQAAAAAASHPTPEAAAATLARVLADPARVGGGWARALARGGVVPDVDTGVSAALSVAECSLGDAGAGYGCLRCAGQLRRSALPTRAPLGLRLGAQPAPPTPPWPVARPRQGDALAVCRAGAGSRAAAGPPARSGSVTRPGLGPEGSCSALQRSATLTPPAVACGGLRRDLRPWPGAGNFVAHEGIIPAFLPPLPAGSPVGKRRCSISYTPESLRRDAHDSESDSD